MGMKYIVLEIKNGDTKREWPIVFPDMMVHRQVADIVQNHLAVDCKLNSRIIAAGSVSFFGGEVRCDGESETLNIESRGSEDEKLIKMFDYLHGIV
jgi:hypothetical protein